MRPLEVRHFGLVAYAEALELQRALVEARKADQIPDTLLLLQHPHVLTVGVKSTAARPHILATAEQLQSLDVQLFETGRGGDVTYHGPGQIVGYPILDLSPDRRDVHRYVRDLEEVLIRVCADYGIEAGRVPGLSGAWASPSDKTARAEKIGAIGVRISKWVTSHGFAFNVNTNLDFFRLIIPCGISDRGVTSMERLLGEPQPLEAVEARIVQHFGSVFDRRVGNQSELPERHR